MPQRMPYSTQEKLGTSGGSGVMPCGAGMIPRGIARSIGQYSIFMTIWTMSCLPSGPLKGGRSDDS